MIKARVIQCRNNRQVSDITYEANDETILGMDSAMKELNEAQDNGITVTKQEINGLLTYKVCE